MEITIHARHCSVPESIRNQSLIRLQRLLRYNAHVLGATVVFSADGSDRQTDIRLAMKGGSPVLGKGQGGTFRTAHDRAVARIQSQLKRRNQRYRVRRARVTEPVLEAGTA